MKKQEKLLFGVKAEFFSSDKLMLDEALLFSSYCLSAFHGIFCTPPNFVQSW